MHKTLSTALLGACTILSATLQCVSYSCEAHIYFAEPEATSAVATNAANFVTNRIVCAKIPCNSQHNGN